MGLFSRFFERRSAPQSEGFNPFARVFSDVSDAGVVVTELSAMRTAAVLACVRAISETIAGLPFHVYREEGGVRRRDPAHPLNRVIYTGEPSEYMTSFTLRDCLLTQLLMYGNSFAQIERDDQGNVTAILPLHSPEVTVKRINGRVFYITRGGDILTADKVLHLMGLTYNGITGLSPIQQAKAAVGLAIATEQFGSKFFGRGAHLNGLFERTGNLSPDAAKAFKEEWTKFHSGIGNAHGTPLLPIGVTYKALTIPPESAQFLETRKFQRSDIAAIYRCPPYIVGDHEHSTFSNLESQGRQFVQFTLAGWIVRLEQECNRKLFREDERGTYTVKLNVDGLQRGDMAARQSFYANGRQWGYLNADDIRALEDLPPLPNGAGQTYLSPVNMQPAGQQPATPPPPDQSAARALLDSTVKRFTVKESKAVARAAKKHQGQPDELRKWAVEFYREHRQLVADALAPALKAAGLSTDANSIARRYCDEAIRMIDAAITDKCYADELVADIEERAGELVDELLNEDGGLRNAA